MEETVEEPYQQSTLFETIRVKIFRLPPSLEYWFEDHPKITKNIKWQYSFEDNLYEIPETAKRSWTDWSDTEKNDLQQAFNHLWKWHKSAGTIPPSKVDLPYPPTNLQSTKNNNGAPWTAVENSYAWNLFIQNIALQLVLEIGNLLPWSIRKYNDEQLQVLFDSAAIMSRRADGSYIIGSASPCFKQYINRKSNLGASLIAPPTFAYEFLVNSGLIGATKLATIGNLLQWISNNLLPSIGGSTYLNMEKHWQYRGLPPISRMIEGSTNPSVVSETTQHWTPDSHGTTGFIRNVLRVVNIPVHISTICDLSQACFLTENLYLDNGDNLYNTDFISTEFPASDLLIDHNTYVSWFGTETINREEGCENLGRQVKELSGY
ncbi:MAG: hypothetical protein HQK84_11070 [Nitrospinae bacterium]|nr:hypothetical protein [Nitrospinota bacterium]